MSKLEPTASPTYSITTLPAPHTPSRALEWADFGLTAACMTGGAIIGLFVSVPIGIALITTGSIKVIVNVIR
ncbi:hypothetical protein ACIQWR_38735 [Streptomyces sp. NPDC098789]|uniref:hypothetical protein n=1 Tax=Streptomyces sp. NPDC098789 TaxID=3366098 RepID=UPI0038124BEE